MNRNTDIILNALKRQADDRGFVRTTLVQLAADTALSRATVHRLLERLSESGDLAKRSRGGAAGGLQIRLKTVSKPSHETVSKPSQNETVRDAFTRGSGPEGALDPPLSATATVSTVSTAYRHTRPGETPDSKAELLYVNDDENGQWRRISPTLWVAPNGDTVSIRSMTPELKRRLNADAPIAQPNSDAIKAIRTIIDR